MLDLVRVRDWDLLRGLTSFDCFFDDSSQLVGVTKSKSELLLFSDPDRDLVLVLETGLNLSEFYRLEVMIFLTASFSEYSLLLSLQPIGFFKVSRIKGRPSNSAFHFFAPE